MFYCRRKFFFFFFSSNRNPITDSSWCGVLCSNMIGLLHAFFRNNSEARVYLWDSKCWEYEDTSWHSWISVRDGNFICFFSMKYTFIFQSRCANNFVKPIWGMKCKVFPVCIPHYQFWFIQGFAHSIMVVWTVHQSILKLSCIPPSPDQSSDYFVVYLCLHWYMPSIAAGFN